MNGFNLFFKSWVTERTFIIAGDFLNLFRDQVKIKVNNVSTI